MDNKRDEELLAEHLAGRPGAFEILVARYADDLYAFFQRFVGKAGAADDLVQETFLQVHLSAGTFDPSRSFKPWLYTIAANKGRDYMRARGRRPAQSLDQPTGGQESASLGDWLEAAGATADDDLATRELRQRVRALMSEMPEAQRLILVLGHFHRLPYAEIAEILGIPVGTVKSRLHAAVNRFAALWLARSPDGRAGPPPGAQE